ncbi:hypothetical protein KDL45_11110, partial [bacterium]|nr:hypothetical protein [bacterium]
ATASYQLVVRDERAIRIIADHDLIWIKDHVDDDLMPKFREITTNVMREGYSRRNLAEALADGLGEAVDADAEYWSDLADHTATKAREIGRISGFEEAGIEKARVVAIIDGRTSAMCQTMNGRVIELTHLARQRDNILAATSADELKSAMAWPNTYTGPTSALPQNVGIPPYHYRCRSTLQAIVRPVKATAVAGARISLDDQQMIDQFSPEEHWYRADDLRKQAKKGKLPWNEKDWKHDVAKSAHLVKHGKGFFGDDAKAYAKRTNETIDGADHVLVQIHRPKRKGSRPRMQYRFLNSKTDAMSIVDASGEIRGTHGSRDVDRTVAEMAKERMWLRQN